MIMGDMISHNVKNIPPSGIRKFFDLVNEMEDVISLSIGEPDFKTPWNIREAGIYSLERGYTSYSPNLGFMELRDEISNYIKRKYDVCYDSKEQIIVTVGGSEAIDIALRALVGTGDEVIIPEPGFVAYKPCTTFTGATPIVVNLRFEDEFKLTPELLNNAITDKTKVLILSYPNNPTGAIMTHEDLAAIVKVLKNKNIIVIADEVYSELTYDGKHASIVNFPEMQDRTILVNGLSKAYSMTGWRLGYACGHRDIIGAMAKIHQYAIMSSPTLAQYAAIEALKNSDEDVAMMAREYKRRKRVMVDGFRKADLPCFEPMGAFYVFPCITPTGMNSTEFCEKLLQEERVAVVPGTAFGECGEGFVRACYAASIEKINDALNRINRFVSRYRKG